MLRPRPRTALVLFLLVGGATIAGAWGFQLIGGYLPCPLCLEQRVPYYVALPLAGLALAVLVAGRPALAALAIAAAGVAMAYGAALGVYQAGAEWGWWAGPAGCAAAAATDAATVRDLMSQLRTTRIVSCTDPSWRLLGLSFAGWNAVISAGLAGLAAVAATGARRNGSTSAIPG